VVAQLDLSPNALFSRVVTLLKLETTCAPSLALMEETNIKVSAKMPTLVKENTLLVFLLDSSNV